MAKRTAAITMTYELAMAAAKDAANRRMRAAGRTSWNRADYNHMCREFDRLFPLEMELASLPVPAAAAA